MELLTLLSYMFELWIPNQKDDIGKKKVKAKKVKLTIKERKKYIEDVWLNPEFYAKHKNDTNLRELWKLSKKNHGKT